MRRGTIGKTLAALGGLILLQNAALAQEACGTPVSSDCRTCQTHHCPPFFRWCQEGAPRLKFQHGCPKPVCNPCDMPNWGYFQTCWSPWPWPPDFSHCPVPTPASQVAPGLIMPPAAVNRSTIGDQLPPPRKTGL
jgi:hypothetical protein